MWWNHTSLNIGVGQTIYDVKLKIMKDVIKQNLDLKLLRLQFAGRYLDEEKTLADEHIKEDYTIFYSFV